GGRRRRASTLRASQARASLSRRLSFRFDLRERLDATLAHRRVARELAHAHRVVPTTLALLPVGARYVDAHLRRVRVLSLHHADLRDDEDVAQLCAVLREQTVNRIARDDLDARLKPAPDQLRHARRFKRA